ncbi:MAG TPA: nucleotidyltransferase family protein [Chloroflexota bacterium]|nr:nucleotidyltransferase family protein [Chloroflexota bacterium]
MTDLTESAKSRVGGILLAAGTSSRLGQPKQLLDFHGKPLVRQVAEQALKSRLGRLHVVVGYHADEVRTALSGLAIEIVDNHSYQSGQSTSLRTGLLSIPRDLKAAMILLTDQPFVDSHLIDQLIGLYEESGALIVAPQYKGRRGNPVIFDQKLHSEILTVVGDTGARDVIARHRDQLVTLELTSDQPFLDVDTWEDYHRLACESNN